MMVRVLNLLSFNLFHLVLTEWGPFYQQGFAQTALGLWHRQVIISSWMGGIQIFVSVPISTVVNIARTWLKFGFDYLCSKLGYYLLAKGPTSAKTFQQFQFYGSHLSFNGKSKGWNPLPIPFFTINHQRCYVLSGSWNLKLSKSHQLYET